MPSEYPLEAAVSAPQRGVAPRYGRQPDPRASNPLTANTRPASGWSLQVGRLEPLASGTGPSVATNLVPLSLTAEMAPPELPAYGRILLDVLEGRSALSIRADEGSHR